jgi:hypothetical protein
MCQPHAAFIFAVEGAEQNPADGVVAPVGVPSISHLQVPALQTSE